MLSPDSKHWADFRKHYPILKDRVYFMNASIAGIHTEVTKSHYDAAMYMQNMGAIDDQQYFEKVMETRQSIGDYLQTSSQNVALGASSSHNMNLFALMLKSDIKTKVIAPKDEFPSSILPWHHHDFQVELIDSRDGRVRAKDLLDAIDDQTACVVTSVTQFQNGFRQDMSFLGQELKKQGIAFIVNATQSMGVFPTTPESWQVSALTASCHKWLGSGIGQAILYISPEFCRTRKFPMIGWCSVEDPWQLNTEASNTREDVGSLELGSAPYSLISAVQKSIEISSSIGIENISKRVLYLSDLLETTLKKVGAKIHSPREQEKEKSGIIQFSLPELNSSTVIEKLKEDQIYLNMRRGTIRASVHFYNSLCDIERLEKSLQKIICPNEGDSLLL